MVSLVNSIPILSKSSTTNYSNIELIFANFDTPYDGRLSWLYMGFIANN